MCWYTVVTFQSTWAFSMTLGPEHHGKVTNISEQAL